MSELAVSVEGLGKRYQLGRPQERYSTLRDQVGRLASAPLRAVRRRGARPGRPPSFWALKDVSFEVARGEVIGVIGRNGAGKSTLLKILSRITEPTEGQADIHGRVSSLLEVGTGFHPELTGRENVFLNGAILGMRREEIARKFDEIVAFAEVEQFIDTAVKHYSSGMYMRLAFAVAAHLEPEILIVDEVLAVGDAQFQKKCIGRMGDVGRSGRTVLFVSHNMAAVEQLTNRCVLLQRGFVVYDGTPREAVGRYLSGANIGDSDENVESLPREWQFDQEIQFIGALVDHPYAIVSSGETLRLKFRIRFNESLSRFRMGITVFRFDGIPIGNTFSEPIDGLPSGSESSYTVHFPGQSLAPGKYFLGISVGRGDHINGSIYEYDVISNCLHFEVRPPEADGATVAIWTPGWGSIIFPRPGIMRIDP